MLKENIPHYDFELPPNQPINGSPDQLSSLDTYLPGDGAVLSRLDLSALLPTVELSPLNVITDFTGDGRGVNDPVPTCNSGSCSAGSGGCTGNQGGCS